MAHVTRRPLAAADILDIWDHIAEDSLDQADRWVDKLDEKFGILSAQPLMGRARKELAADLRSFPFGRYVIFYVPIEGGIDVVRVLHSARDVDAAFGGAVRRR
jgi:toxin ParE1/3/4